MPELPFVTLSSVNAHTSISATPDARFDIHTEVEGFKICVSSDPRRSPVTASMDADFGCQPSGQNTFVQSAVPKVCDVAEIADIILAARDFSDLTNPSVVRAVCCAKILSWRDDVVESQVSVAQIMAGLTNQLFAITLKSSVPEHIKPRKALFRVYGKSVGDLYDSSFELKVFKTLASNESAPKLIAEFPGGRIEEYIFGPSLLMKDMSNPSVLCAVASILGKFHTLDATVAEIKSWKTPDASMWKCLNRWSENAWNLYNLAKVLSVTAETSSSKFSLDSTSTQDLLVRKALLMTEAAKNSLVHSLEDTCVVEMYAEVKNLKKYLHPTYAKPTPILDVAFCHNDVQENNILVTGTRLRLIDFEYADFNYPAFDIANFHCEMTMDYCVEDPANFPSEEVVRMFGSVYLSQYLGRSVLPSNNEELSAFVESVYRFALASHMLWGFWSIIRSPQAATSSDFDFLLYAKSRFTAYKKWKAFLFEKGYLRE